MKKIKIFTLSLLIIVIAVSLVSCKEKNKVYSGQTLTIFNVEDYISNGNDDSVDIIGEFEKEYGVKVNYYTYDTNETMYNQFTLQKEGTYDLICTSDYMIQRMVKEGLVEKFDDFSENIPNYYTYASTVLRNKLKDMTVSLDSNNETVSLDDYAVGYMWGTLGLVYDSVYTETIQEDIKSWDILYDTKYADTISLKNSMRDAYVAGLMHRYSKDPNFIKLMNEYLDNPSDKEIAEKYNNLIQDIFDFKLDGSASSNQENLEKIQAVKEELILAKDNIFGFEVDSGKNDIITGKIKIDMAYSGDAVYSITTGRDEADKALEYFVPLDGSNIWYDAWTLPKGANKELAYLFLDYLSDPYNASCNMEYIGYTPYIVGDDLLTMASRSYGASDFKGGSEYYKEDLVIFDHVLYSVINDNTDENINEENYESLEIDFLETYTEGDMVSYNGLIYNCISDTDENFNEESFLDYFEENVGYDLTFLFSGTLSENRRAIIYPWLGYENQLETQYPTEEIIARCAIMNHFGEYNENVIIMWGQVKAYTNMLPVYLFLGIFVSLVIIVAIIFIVKNYKNNKYKKHLVKKS